MVKSRTWARNKQEKPRTSYITREKENYQILLESYQKDSGAGFKGLLVVKVGQFELKYDNNYNGLKPIKMFKFKSS